MRNGEVRPAGWTINPSPNPIMGRQNVLATGRAIEFELIHG
jgi:hypothetical protein